MVTTVPTPLRDAPRGNTLRDLPAGVKVRVTGEAKHKAFPVSISGQQLRGWIARDDLAPVTDDDLFPVPDGQGGQGGVLPTPDVPASEVGVRIAKSVDEDHLRRAFGLLLLVVAVQLAIRGVRERRRYSDVS